MKAIAGTQYGSQGAIHAQDIARSTEQGSALARSLMTYSRVIGALFLLGFLSYGGGLRTGDFLHGRS
ncbi:MAG: hypothetical protein ABJA50_09360 [Chloroflexota bacterium]